MNVETKIFNYRILLWLVKIMIFILNLLTFTIRLIPLRAFSSIILQTFSFERKVKFKAQQREGGLLS